MDLDDDLRMSKDLREKMKTDRPRRHSPWRWAYHRLRAVNLFVAILLTTFLLVLVGSLAWWLIGFALAGEPTYLLARGSDTRGDATRIALTIVAGFGGAVALVVTYRKQSRAEDGSFLERLSTAARLLG